MPWSISRLPSFIAVDSAEMLVELVAFQAQALRRGVVDEEAYADAYARVFGARQVADFIYQPPLLVAHGITTLIREVGLFALQDDSAAIATLAEQAAWKTRLPPPRIARIENGVPVYTPPRQQQLVNRRAIEMLIHRAAALAFAERLPSIAIDDLPKTIRLRDVTTYIFDLVIAESAAANDGTLRMLRQVRTAAWRLIDVRYGAPQEEGVLITNAPLPSLVCAHYAYREARQAQRIRDANPVAHPNFMVSELVIPPWP